jgi:hypothetical protein
VSCGGDRIFPLRSSIGRGVLASLCDGAGAQSMFALAKQGRRFASACLLVKSEVGVRDAWVRDGMTRAEADALIAEIVAGGRGRRNIHWPA